MEQIKWDNKLIWIGRSVSLIAILPFLMSAYMKFVPNPEMLQGCAHLGIPLNLITTLGVLETLCIILYVLPWTSILGAIIFTGYIGGAICAHLRIGESVLLLLSLGISIWLGLYLRDSRLRALLPLRSSPIL